MQMLQSTNNYADLTCGQAYGKDKRSQPFGLDVQEVMLLMQTTVFRPYRMVANIRRGFC